MHDIEEIQNDIFKVEGIAVDIEEYSLSDKFITKYSEIFKNQINGSSDQSDLSDRIEEYLKIDQMVKDKLLEKLVSEIRLEERREKVSLIMSRHIVTSVITTILVVSVLALVHFL